MGIDVRDTVILCSSWAQSAESGLNLTVPSLEFVLFQLTFGPLGSLKELRRAFRRVRDGNSPNKSA